jgi:putative CocE/NonD family hydrolase
MRVLTNVTCPASDGVRLASDVYLPDGVGPWPTILQRTPYNKVGMLPLARRYVEQGFAFVGQDVRGRWESGGERRPFDERDDSGAAVVWTAEQPWCNGRIGMAGASYLALVQYAAASHRHPALRCIAPNAIMGDFFSQWSRLDGPFALANAVRWSLANAAAQTTPMIPVDWPEIWAQRTLPELFTLVGQEWSFIREMVEHDTYDDYWQRRDLSRMVADIAVPALHLDGWFDHCNNGSAAMYTRCGRDGRAPIRPRHHPQGLRRLRAQIH